MSNSKSKDKGSELCPHSSGYSMSDYAKQWDLEEESNQLLGVDANHSKDLVSVARQAWRNSVRCTGRALWKTLQVVDARDVRSPEEVFDQLVKHIRLSTNSGRIQSVMTVFREWNGHEPKIRIWNHQLFRYAGYELADGSVLGDPMNRALTEVALSLGWEAPLERGPFDLLPIVIQVGDRLAWYPIPSDAVLEVSISHPHYDFVKKLGLKWYAVPIIADMIFAAGSDIYSCAPFNGHYMVTEIAVRNFGDTQRYNRLPEVEAQLSKLHATDKRFLRDHALIVLTEAVLWSYEQAGIRITDHHKSAKDFVKFCEYEESKGRVVQADWSWIVPPISGAATPVYSRSFSCKPQLPNFFLQSPAWESKRGKSALEKYTHTHGG